MGEIDFKYESGGDTVSEFESLLKEHFLPLQRYVRYKISNRHDAEDILQEVCLTASQSFETLKDKGVFKAWLIGIAGHKCTDYYRRKARDMEIPLESLSESALGVGRCGITAQNVVRETLDALGDREKQILYLYYFRDLPQDEIAKRLNIPIGTVKSRLHYAKEKFKEQYPYKTRTEGETKMMKLPEYLPEYKIEKTDLPPFSVRWEELQGWLLIPRGGEKLTWGLYDMPSGKRTEYTVMEVIGKAEIHGIEGVEITAVQYDAEDYYRTGSVDRMERRFVAQLTETHCRYLAESHVEDGVRKMYTFLDGDAFLNNWGFGAENCGNEVNLHAKGLLCREGQVIDGTLEKETVDIVGRYHVAINGKTYDTVCVMDIQCFNDGVVTEQYLDQNGRTVLWRRFNKNDWAFSRYGKLWTEMLPDNERLTVNGETYVHWYDCVTDYIF